MRWPINIQAGKFLKIQYTTGIFPLHLSISVHGRITYGTEDNQVVRLLGNIALEYYFKHESDQLFFLTLFTEKKRIINDIFKVRVSFKNSRNVKNSFPFTKVVTVSLYLGFTIISNPALTLVKERAHLHMTAGRPGESNQGNRSSCKSLLCSGSSDYSCADPPYTRLCLVARHSRTFTKFLIVYYFVK